MQPLPKSAQHTRAADAGDPGWVASAPKTRISDPGPAVALIAYAQVNDLIRSADGKAAALLAASGVLGGLLVSNAPDLSGGFRPVARVLFFLLAIVAVVLSTLSSLHALQPRLDRGSAPTSLLYFDHVARRYGGDSDGYVRALAMLADDAKAVTRDLGTQICVNSVVARRKFRGVTLATWFIGAAMLCAAATALLDRP